MMAASNACSRALQITEIVRMICEESTGRTPRSQWPAGAQPPRPGPSARLPVLARTSRIFMEPALDLIWAELPSLTPLVKCMPETLWEQRRENVSNGTVFLRRPIMASDLPRLLFYSVRVKRLTDSWRYAVLHSEVLYALSMALTSHSFMPRLSFLNWTPVKDALPFMHHLLGPNMRTLIIDLNQSKASFSLFPYIQNSCPLVSKFILRLGSTTPRQYAIPLLSDVVCGWHNLRELTIPNLDRRGFAHISRLPLLVDIDLTSVAGQPGTLHLPDFLSGLTFPALKFLRIASESAYFCAGLIQMISSPGFESLTLSLLKNWTAAAWKELFDTIRVRLDLGDLGRLSQFEIEVSESCDRVRPEDVAQYTLTADTLRPLLALKSITTFCVQIYPGPIVDDEFLGDIAVAWPGLRMLELGSEVLMTEVPTATLSCLIPFARHCPELLTLGIRIRPYAIPDFSQMPGERIEHTLYNLNVGTSPIIDDETKLGNIAAFISNLFPELQALNTFDHLPTDNLITYANTWQRVCELLPVMSSIRLQEKDFWTKELAAEQD